jgi:hypothetical protein
MPTPNRPADRWAPQYFLASVGAGGLTVTFFLWLYMWVPHPGQAVPVFEDIARAFAAGSPAMQAMIVAAALGVAGFAAINLWLLVWNLARHAAFRRTEAHAALRTSAAETQLAALPLAIAMAINVGFILGLVFVPGLWGVVEALFPLALAAFAANMVLTFAQIGRFLGRVIGHSGVDLDTAASFGPALPAFALAMTGVGMAAPASLSTVPETVAVSLALSTLALVAAAIHAAVAVVVGLSAMLRRGVSPEAAPTLLLVVPLMTVLAILMLRQDHGLHAAFGAHAEPTGALMLLTQMLAVQVVFGLFGLAVLRTQGYGRRFLTGTEVSAGSYALVCPGVAVSVMLQFWINKGLVGAGIIVKFGAAYWALSAVAVGFQLAMVVLIVVLNRRHFRRPAAGALAAA